MDASDLLSLLKNAGGDAALLTLASVDLSLPTLAPDDFVALEIALEAAAIPHWCDEEILAELLELPVLQARDQWSRLKTLPVVEPFSTRGEDAGNVHGASRLAIRGRLAESDKTKFRQLSSSAASCREEPAQHAGVASHSGDGPEDGLAARRPKRSGARRRPNTMGAVVGWAGFVHWRSEPVNGHDDWRKR